MNNEEKDKILIKFEDGDFSLDVKVSPSEDTVWLNREQLALLFGRDIKTIGKHINNILTDELDNSVVAFFATTATDGKTYNIRYYNLDMITAIGYRIKSSRTTKFKEWALNEIKKYKAKTIKKWLYHNIFCSIMTK
ncbi:MAG: virulence RhuM family protein [Acholeplasmatales bacterium]|nr:virulence RhuM family protein [Acholeplasmatales bacterium]